MRTRAMLVLSALALLGSTLSAAEAQQKDMKGQPAGPLNGAFWVGVPVSMDAVKGNMVMLAFWNADAPC
jgi:hypothetical protein